MPAERENTPSFNVFVTVAVLLMVGVLAYFGEQGKAIERVKQDKQNKFLDTLVAVPQPVEVTIPAYSATPYYRIGRSTEVNWKYNWTTWETPELTLVDESREGTTLCPSVLGDFLSANGYESVPQALVDGYAAKLAGKKVSVWVRVPHFPVKPDLSQCPGFTWDESSGNLKLRGKPLGFMVEAQPNLNLAMSQ